MYVYMYMYMYMYIYTCTCTCTGVYVHCSLYMYFSRAGTGVTLAKSLELLKAVLQTSFNHEIKRLCDDYFQVRATGHYCVVTIGVCVCVCRYIVMPPLIYMTILERVYPSPH